jgi:hypothetical protein
MKIASGIMVARNQIERRLLPASNNLFGVERVDPSILIKSDQIAHEHDGICQR